MQVSPINKGNINTKGRFVKNTTMERLLMQADIESLKAFRNIVKRAKKVDDGNIFKIASFVGARHDEYGRNYKNYNFQLLKSTEDNEFCKSILDMVSFDTSVKETKENFTLKMSNVLKKFIPTLENYYPQGNNNESREFLISEIKKDFIIE